MEKIKGFLLRLLVQSWCSQVFMGSFVRLFPLVSSKCHKRLVQTHARRAINKTIAREEEKIAVKDWSHLLHKNGCPNPNQVLVLLVQLSSILILLIYLFSCTLGKKKNTNIQLNFWNWKCTFLDPLKYKLFNLVIKPSWLTSSLIRSRLNTSKSY